MRTEAVYICEYCGKKFTTIEPCRKHEKTHTDELPRLNIQVWNKEFNLMASPLTVDSLRNLKKTATAIYIGDEETRKIWKKVNGNDYFQTNHLMYYDDWGEFTEDGDEWIDITDRYNELNSELSAMESILDSTINKVIDK